MQDVAVATVVAKNYLSFARVLAQSFLRHHPDIPLFVLLSDEVDGFFDVRAEPFRLLRLADLEIPEFDRVRFRCDRKQLAITSKSYLLSHLLDRGFGSAIFLDPDILILSDLEELFSQVSRHAIVLMPHLLAPLSGEGSVERELNILQSGVYNGGFVGISSGSTARAFLAWWRARVYAHCRHDVPRGVYYDQRWLDLAPVFFPGLHVFRDPSYNVAHWNLPERAISIGETSIAVDGRPCRFFHFSGFDPDNPFAVTRYSSRLNLSNVGPAAELFRRYRQLLEAAGYHETKAWPYAYGSFDNGVLVSDAARRAYRELGEAAGRFGDPFETASPGSFFHWLRRPGARRP
jgi:hypothetical protein